MVTQQQILADLAAIRKQLKKTKKAHKMTTQQFSQLHENTRPVNMIVMTCVADEEEMERTRECYTRKKVSRHWKSKPTKPWYIWEENASGNCRKPFGEVMLLLSIHGLRRAHDGKTMRILKMSQVSQQMIPQNARTLQFLLSCKEPILQIHSMWIHEQDLLPQHKSRVKLLILAGLYQPRIRHEQYSLLLN